ncbi:MAG: hypothetical protein N2Z23_00900 [Pyrinomonadaceae bacterium]|nr:hypothetical protein [Pyrinomonadaceae bacterium]MCX7638991.1 hypothetical protein [Pyrinomonadaceae bacterium]MDW8303789.1 hypothetical protein [Acidobacteriota bacterium]
MLARLTVIFLIFLSLEIGLILIIFPWISVGIISDWSNNYLLALVSDRLKMPFLKDLVSSGWVRGAVTGLGILNVLIALWEIVNFRRSVEFLEGKKHAR